LATPIRAEYHPANTKVARQIPQNAGEDNLLFLKLTGLR